MRHSPSLIVAAIVVGSLLGCQQTPPPPPPAGLGVASNPIPGAGISEAQAERHLHFVKWGVPSQQAGALYHLARVKQPRVTDEAKRLLTSDSAVLALSAARTYAKTTGSETLDPAAVKTAIENYEKEDIAMRSFMVQIVADVDDPAVLPVLRKALQDESKTVRNKALGQLANTPNPDLLMDLKGLALAADTEPNVAALAVSSMNRIGDEESGAALSEVLKAAPPHVRVEAALRLAQRGDASGKSVLEEATKSEDTGAMIKGWAGLDHLGVATPKTAKDAIERALQNPNRSQAANTNFIVGEFKSDWAKALREKHAAATRTMGPKRG